MFIMRAFCHILTVIAINLTVASGSFVTFEEKEHNLKNLSRITEFPSVTSWDGIEKYYQDVRTKGSQPPLLSTSRSKRADVKKEICRSILTSYFFKMRSEEYLDTDSKQVRAELKHDLPDDTFRSIYREKHWSSFFGCHRHYKYENAYKTRSVCVGNGADCKDEDVFVCVVKSGAGRVREYFVTREYNVNTVDDGLLIFGRFILSANHHDNNETLVPLAIAEEAAIESLPMRRESDILELVFIITRATEKRNGLSRPTTESTDPVCGLTTENKLRLCSSLFSATAFKYGKQEGPSFNKDELIFAPVIEDGVNHSRCLEKQILFTSPHGGTYGGELAKRFLFLNRNRTYLERMIVCTASTRSGDSIVYYASRGNYDKNNVYVFVDADTEGYVWLYSWFTNISVVGQAQPDLENPPRSLINSDVED